MANERDRRRKLRDELKALKVDAFLATDRANVRYLTGFTGEDSAAIVAPDSAILVTDSRFRTQAKEECRGVRVVARRKGLAETCAREVRKLGPVRLALASAKTSLATYQALAAELGKRRLRPGQDVAQRIRMIKDDAEILAIRRAIEVAERAFARTHTGRTEKEFARKIDDQMRRLGAESSAFETIVAAGQRAALPHARPTKARITGAEPLLIDWGASVDGYNSDLTRMRTPTRIRREFGGLYSAVDEVGMRAMEAAKPGITAGKLDSLARNPLKAKGLAKAFTHSLGHGVGMAVHESPVIGPRADTVLKPGMVITIEPGIYLPGRLGIRIEDMVLITGDGAKRLTTLSRNIRAWRLSKTSH